MATTRNALRNALLKKKVRHLEDVRAAVLFNEDLMGYTLMYCTLGEQGRIKATCRAVQALNLKGALDFAAERRFELEYCYAHEEMLSWGIDLNWVNVWKEWREIVKRKPALTFKKNTRLAKDERFFQKQITLIVSMVTEHKTEFELFFDKGLLEFLWMNQDCKMACSKYHHNMAQWLDLLDATCETDNLLVSHVCGRPLNSFKGISGLKDFLATLKEKTYFTIGILALPDYDPHIPHECCLPPIGLLDALLDDSIISI